MARNWEESLPRQHPHIIYRYISSGVSYKAMKIDLREMAWEEIKIEVKENNILYGKKAGEGAE